MLIHKKYDAWIPLWETPDNMLRYSGRAEGLYDETLFCVLESLMQEDGIEWFHVLCHSGIFWIENEVLKLVVIQ